MVSRARKNVVSEWWWTVDKVVLGLVLAVMFVGIVGSIAASSAVAQRIGLGPFHFSYRHGFFLLLAVPLMVGVSMLSARHARAVAFVVLGVSLLMLLATVFVGFETKGSKRWIPLGPFQIQPSELFKPAFVVTCAWLFAQDMAGRFAGRWIATALAAAAAGLLMLQPDFGQTVLVLGVWGALFFLSGAPMVWLSAIGGVLLAGAVGAYLTIGHVASRIDRFLTGAGDNYQVDRSLEAILRGGWLGRGPGEGSVKKILPDSHTDFVFAAMTEEFGIAAAMGLVALFAAIVARGLTHAMRDRDVFARLATTGLVLVFGTQAFINIGVNLQVLPAKGMTLPLVSYGGSSMLASAFTMGLLLAFTRTRAGSHRRATVNVVAVHRADLVAA